METNNPPKRRLTSDSEPSSPSYHSLSSAVNNALDNLTNYLNKTTEIVTTVERATEVCSLLKESKFVSVDCEGVNLGDRFKGKVTLVQIAKVCNDSSSVWIFDVLGSEGVKVAMVLKSILEDKDVVKIIHDCRSDSTALKSQFGVKLINVFDTQIAHRVITKDKCCGLDTVCRSYGGVGNPFKEGVKGIYRRHQNFWSTRPLTSLMVAYASSDVLCLIPQVYNELKNKIENNEIFKEEFHQAIKDIYHRNHNHRR